MKGAEIEALSFRIIDREAGAHDFAPRPWSIVRRMIHTSADFDYQQTVRLHPRAIDAGIGAILAGRPIVSDTNMARAGIRKPALSRFGVEVRCYMADPAVAQEAQAAGTTRARAAVDRAVSETPEAIFVIGNAPTALLRLVELVKSREARPALIIGLPVGFVNAAESKAALLETDVPYITNVGRKGGSNVAAAVVNALAILAAESG